jgi:hypothetical protein
MWQVWCLPPRVNHFGTQHSSSGTLKRISVTEIKVCGDGRIAENTIGVDDQILGRRITAILPNGSYSPVEMSRNNIGLKEGLDSARENERPLVCNERLSSQLCLLASSHPQSASESRDNDSSDSGDRSLAIVQKFSRASNVVKDHGAASGIFFFVGIALFGGAILAYALLECRRKSALDNNKRNYKPNQRG